MKTLAIACFIVMVLLFLTAGSAFSGYTPEICKAAKKGDLGTVKALVEKSPELLEATNSDRETPLHLASAKGQTAVVQYLLEKGAQINARDEDGETPLHKAAKHGEKDVVELLVNKGADLNLKDDKGRTPLREAINNAREAIEIFLRAHGAKE